MILEFLEQIFSFYSADSDTDATVTCSGVVLSCPLVSRGTDVDLLSEFVIFMIAPSPKIGIIIIIIIKFFKVGLQNSSNMRTNKDQLFTKTK